MGERMRRLLFQRGIIEEAGTIIGILEAIMQKEKKFAELMSNTDSFCELFV